MGDPQQRSHRSTKGRTGKEDGDDLTAPEARSQGDSGKENFQQEGLGESLAGQHGADDGVSCSVVGLLSHQQGEQQHQHAAHRRPGQGIGQHPGVEFWRVVHGLTKQNRHQSAQQAQPRRLEHGQRSESHSLSHRIAQGLVQPQKARQQEGHRRGHRTGHQRGVIHDAHAYHFHSKDSSGKGSAEQGGEGGGHAAHDHDPPVFIVQTDPTAHPGG